MPLRAALTLACLLLLALVPTLVRADDAALHVQVPAECGSGQALARDVAQLLGAAPEALAWPPFELTLAKLAAGYQLQLSLPEGERTLHDADCHSLFRAAVVMVAAAFEAAQRTGQAVASEEETRHALALSTPAAASLSVPSARALSAPKPNAATELPAVVVAPPPRAPAPRPDASVDEAPIPSRRVHVLSGAGAGLVLGLVPGAGLNLELVLGMRITRLSLGLALRYLPPREAAVDDGSVRVQALGSTFAVAYAVLPWLRLGAGVDAYGLLGSGQGVAGARDDWAFTLGPRVESWARLLEGRRGELALGVAGFYQPRPAEFVSSQGDPLHVASSFGFQAGVRGAWDFF